MNHPSVIDLEVRQAAYQQLLETQSAPARTQPASMLLTPTESRRLAEQEKKVDQLFESLWDLSWHQDLGPLSTLPFSGAAAYPAIGTSTPVNPYAFMRKVGKGEYTPYYINEAQLWWHRSLVRNVVSTSEIARNVVSQTRNYVFGKKGLTYTAQLKKTVPLDQQGQFKPLVAQVQETLDAFASANKLSMREKQANKLVHEEGECFIRLYSQANGLLAMRFVNAEQVRSNTGGTEFTLPTGEQADDSYGVVTAIDDVETIYGYMIAQTPDIAVTPRFVPAEQVVHLKYPDTPSNAKRGWSPFWEVLENVARADVLLAATEIMGINRSKIAMHITGTGLTNDVGQKLLQNNAVGTQTNWVGQSGGPVTTVEKWPMGGVLRTNENYKVEYPTGSIGASDNIAVYEAAVRTIGARFAMPYHIISSDASNSNYSSTMVAESPFVRSIEDLQQYYTDEFGASLCMSPYDLKQLATQYNQGDGADALMSLSGAGQSLVWRQLIHSIKRGDLPLEVLDLIDIKCEGPSPIVRDQKAEVDRLKAMMDAKFSSRQYAQTELGLDPAEQDAQMLSDTAMQAMQAQAAAQQQQQMGGQLGEEPPPGDQQPGDNAPPDDSVAPDDTDPPTEELS